MAAWTWMVYMAGDNSLSSAAEEDLEELRRVGSSADLNIFVEVDRAGAGGTRRLRVERDGRGEKAMDLGETDSGAPESVFAFVRWARAQAPADRYALVLWNHGGGWAPEELDRLAAAQGAPLWTPAEARERSGSPLARLLFRRSLETILARPSARERAICSDDGTGHSLDTFELGRLLERVRGELGRPLDLLGMDACLMSSLEVAYEARDCARYLVASEDTEPAAGWPYETVLQTVAADPAIATSALAAHIVTAYRDAHAGAGPGEAITQAAIDLGTLAGLLGPLGELAAAASGAMRDRAPEIWAAQRSSTRFCGDTVWDLLHFSAALRLATASPAMRDAATRIGQALAPGAGPIVAEAHSGRAVERCGGLSVYLPALREISPYYEELAFARDQPWLGFLRAYREALQPKRAGGRG
jgi:cysteine peptidase C11 family protein